MQDLLTISLNIGAPGGNVGAPSRAVPLSSFRIIAIFEENHE